MESLLFILFLIVAGVFVALLVEARFSPRPFAGPPLALSLGLFGVCACISFVRLHSIGLVIVSSGFLDPEKLYQGLHEVELPFYLGFGSSAVALLVHSLLYLLGRQHQLPDHTL